MKLNEIIRKYRKQNNLTQEQVADALGVTAPAVNKWENAVSYPDITLLAPLARLLGIDPNTLLCFHEELTDREFNQYMNELMELRRTEGYDAAFDFASGLIRTYPTCDKLILFAAQVLYSFPCMPPENAKKYKKQITAWLEQVHRNGTELADAARSSLCSIYIQAKDYSRAQQLLDEIPPLGYDKRPMQAMVYDRQGKTEEAYALYEQMLFQHAGQICSSLQLLSCMAYAHGDPAAGAQYIDLAVQANDLLGLSPLSGCIIQLSSAMREHDAARCLELLRQFADIDVTPNARTTLLYPHMLPKQDNLNQFKHMLCQSLQLDEQTAFLRDEPEFQSILQKLQGSSN